MAIQQVNGPFFKLNVANQFWLRDPGDQETGMVVIMIVNDATFVGSVTVKSVIATKEAAASAVAPVAILYRARFLNGAISTDGLVSTAITTTSLIIVPASLQTVVLDCTSYTSGSASVYVGAVAGIAQ